VDTQRGEHGWRRHQQGPEHRHQCPHRFGQDDSHRARPLLHGTHPRHPRGAWQGRGRRHDGLDGVGARARHHHRVRRDPCRLGRPPHQHHRHPRPRGLHHRGGARAARARRCGADPLWRGRRAVAVHDRGSPDEALPRAARRVHQQARSLGCRPREGHAAALREARPQRRDDPAAHRPRERLRGRGRPDQDEGALLRGRQRRKPRREGHPFRDAERRGDRAGDHARRGVHVLRRADGGDPGGDRRGADDPRRDPRWHALHGSDAGLPRLGVQEQGRAAAAQRRRGVSALAPRHQEHGCRPVQQRGRGRAQERCRSAHGLAGVQARRYALRPAHLPARLPGHHRQGQHDLQLAHQEKDEGRSADPHACRRDGGDRSRERRRHRRALRHRLCVGRLLHRRQARRRHDVDACARSGDLALDQARRSEGLGQHGQGPRPLRARGSDLPCRRRQGEQRDGDLGHGRAPPRSVRRAHEAPVARASTAA